MKILRIYADTSVFGGCYDDEFASASLEFFSEVRAGRYILVLSTVTLAELSYAPEEVRGLLAGIEREHLQVVDEEMDIRELRDAYLRAGVVGPQSSADAEHIAAASVADVDIIVSWNFRHIVHYDKIRQYHAVNIVQGYRAIPIHTPREVADEEEGI